MDRQTDRVIDRQTNRYIKNIGLLTAGQVDDRALFRRHPHVRGPCVEDHFEVLAGGTDVYGTEVLSLWKREVRRKLQRSYKAR